MSSMLSALYAVFLLAVPVAPLLFPSLSNGAPSAMSSLSFWSTIEAFYLLSLFIPIPQVLFGMLGFVGWSRSRSLRKQAQTAEERKSLDISMALGIFGLIVAALCLVFSLWTIIDTFTGHPVNL